MALFVNDFDGNSSTDPILCSYWGDTLFPRVLRHNLISQLPYLKKENLLYKEYAGKSVFEVFDTLQLERSALLQAQTLRPAVYFNNGNGTFSHWHELPLEAQIAPVYAIDVVDVNGDGANDIIMGGNLFEVQPEWGRYDASRGTVCFLASGTRAFEAVGTAEIWTQCRRPSERYHLLRTRGGETFVLFSKVDGPMEEYKINK
jgi:hypothetical protein